MAAFEGDLQRNAAVAAVAPRGDEMFMRYVRWMPVLWFLGASFFVMCIVVVRMVWRKWPTSPAINLITLSWAAVAAAQGVAIFWNWYADLLPPGFLLTKMLSNLTLGWLFVGGALAAGYGSQMAGPLAVRAMMRFALWVLIFGIIGYAAAMLTSMPNLYFETPVFLALGGRRGASFYTLASFFIREQHVGTARLVLFFPWPTCLSLAGVCLVLISLCERDRRWRWIGFLGGGIAVALSFSRAGYVVLPLSLGTYMLFRARLPWLAAGVAVLCAVGLAMAVTGFNPAEYLREAKDSFHGSRAGSSMARDLIYEESWKAFLQHPLLGLGWVGGSIISQEDIPIGSHSTLFGTLYTGGLVTFGALVLATLVTAGVAVWRAVVDRSREAAAAVAIIVAFVFFAYGESIYSLVLPLIFAFMFLGGALIPAREKRSMS